MKEMNIVEARSNFSELVAQVAFGGVRVVVERRGKPMAALISMADLQRLEDFERQALSGRVRGRAALDRAAALRRTILAERGGEYLPDSADAIAEIRGERLDDLSDLR